MKLPIAAVLCLSSFWLGGCSEQSTELDDPGLFFPDDLEVTLWAQSPMFYNPTNMDVDMKGRIWITEAVNYRNYNNDSTKVLHHQKGDRIMILEDSDHDGKADTSKLFVEDKDLVSPLGIAVIGNRIIVSCSPHLIVYTDNNGDDIPDSKEILLTGFGGLDHDHSLHAVVGGPDGNWYFNTGNAGPHVVKDRGGWMLRSGSLYTGGSPYNNTNTGNMKSDDGKVWVGGLALRVSPTGTALKVMGHNFRNSYESAIDSYGNLWQNDNDDQVVACRTSWLMEGGNAGYFSADGTRYWQADQRPWQSVFNAHWHQDDPGVMPAGDDSGAGAPTGIMRYEGNALGDAYTGMIFSADAGRNVVFGYKPSPSMSGYTLGSRSNFLTSLSEDNELYVWNDSLQNTRKDKWFRPSDVVTGTDGTLYVADWYDPVVGGHQMQDSTGYGRIYRVTRKGTHPKNPKLDAATLKGLVEMLRNPAVNVRAFAATQLVAKGAIAVGPVSELLEHGTSFERARAIWILSKLGKTAQGLVLKQFNNSDPEIRMTAFRAIRQTDNDILPYAARMSHDTSAMVRREVAVAIRDLPFEKTKTILLSMARSIAANDRWNSVTWAAACRDHEDEIFTGLQKQGVIDDDPSEWTPMASAIMFQLHPASAVESFRKRAVMEDLPDEERTRAVSALAMINTTDAVDAMSALAGSPSSSVKEQATYWLAFRQGNEWFGLADWSKMNIDPAMERNIAAMKVKRNKVLDARLPFDERKWNVQDMAKNPVGGQMILVMVADSLLPKALYPFVEESIFQNPATAVRIQATSLFRKAGKNYSIPEILKLPPDLDSGKAVFLKSCTPCHRRNKVGSDIAPDLTAIGKKLDRPSLLDAIIHPSAGIVFGYEPWLVTTRSGDSYYGFVVADGDKTLVIRDLVGRRHVIRTADVKSRKKQEHSMMPEPASFGFSEQDLANLSAYLMRP